MKRIRQIHLPPGSGCVSEGGRCHFFQDQTLGGGKIGGCAGRGLRHKQRGRRCARLSAERCQWKDAAPPSETLRQCKVAEMPFEAAARRWEKQNLHCIWTLFARVGLWSGQRGDAPGAGVWDNFQIRELVNFEWPLPEHRLAARRLQGHVEDPHSCSRPHWLETVCQLPEIKEDSIAWDQRSKFV